MMGRVERALGLEVNRPVFFASAAIIALVVPLAAVFEAQFSTFFGDITHAIATHMGWFYILSVTSLLLFLLWVAFGPAAHIRLGPDDAKPQYSNVAWFTMLFAAGIGTVLLFWGVAEPISHFAEPPLHDVEPGTPRAAGRAMDFALYHFGLHTWAIFAMPGLAVGYFVYRKGLPLRFRSVFQPLLGSAIDGPIGHLIDTVAVVGTMFGVATSLGIGTLQVTKGLEFLFGITDDAVVRTTVVLVITAIATISVAAGLDKGVRRLSEFNIALAVLLMLFVFVTGPTVYILEGLFESIGSYLSALPRLAFWNDAHHQTGWQEQWTIFYWAWTASWAPFVGIFVARISYGRTMRQFVSGVLLAPTLFTIVWFSVFGIAAFDIELNGAGGLADQVGSEVAVAIYVFLEHFPLAEISSGVALLVAVIFFTTSSDSASLVIDLLSNRRGDGNPGPTRQRVFWAVAEGVVAASLLFAGGYAALANVITTIAFPFCAILIFMAIALARAILAEHGKRQRGITLPSSPPES